MLAPSVTDFSASAGSPRVPRDHGGSPESAGSSENRMLALVSFCRAVLSHRFGVRLGWVLGILTAGGYGLAMLALVPRFGGDLAGSLALKGVSWISWLGAAPAACSLARGLDLEAREASVLDLAGLAGFTRRSLDWGRLGATELILFRLLGLPGLALGGLAVLLSDVPALAGSRVLLLIGIALYIGLFSTALTLISWICSALSPQRGPWLFLLIVLAPMAARQVWPGTLSLPSLFGDMIERLATLEVGAG